jgi:hypothetical protein
MKDLKFILNTQRWTKSEIPVAVMHYLRNPLRSTYFPKLLIVGNTSCFRQTEIHTAELGPPHPTSLEVEIAIANLEGKSRQVVLRFRQP